MTTILHIVMVGLLYIIPNNNRSITFREKNISLSKGIFSENRAELAKICPPPKVESHPIIKNICSNACTVRSSHISGHNGKTASYYPFGSGRSTNNNASYDFPRENYFLTSKTAAVPHQYTRKETVTTTIVTITKLL